MNSQPKEHIKQGLHKVRFKIAEDHLTSTTYCELVATEQKKKIVAQIKNVPTVVLRIYEVDDNFMPNSRFYSSCYGCVSLNRVTVFIRVTLSIPPYDSQVPLSFSTITMSPLCQ